MEKVPRLGDCLRSCLHQVRNKDLLLSWLPVVCPVGRPTAEYRTPTAPTRYLSTANTNYSTQRPEGEVDDDEDDMKVMIEDEGK